jgi:hypothetical protein
VTRDPAAWYVLLKDRFPACISWEQYERDLARLKANQARAEEVGAVRQGAALLAGLVACGKCGARMTVRYSGQAALPGYWCTRQMSDYGGEPCQQLAGPCLDQFVSHQMLGALEPAALELSLEAAQHLERERADLERVWRQRLERAAYEGERARRQYQLVEPENRLVTRQLEHEWEEKLRTQQHLQEDYGRFMHAQPRLLSAAERTAIRQLAADIPALWHAATTTAAERKEILRQVLARVIVDVHGESERVQVRLEWVGGTCTEGELIRPVARWEQLSYYPQVCQRVSTLAAEGLTAAAIAAQLNAEGYRPPKRRERFGQAGILGLLQRLGQGKARSRAQRRDGLGPHEWWLPELARTIGMPAITLHSWLRRGWVTGHQQEQVPRHWILWADAAEVERLRQRHQRPRGYYTRRLWIEDTPELPG